MKPPISFKYRRATICLTLIIAFVGSSLYAPQAQGGEMVVPYLPLPGVMVHLSPAFVPAHLQGLTIYPENALKFDFLIHRGEGHLNSDQKKEEYTKLVKYFLASLTIPDKDQWVNLSPYEHRRIIQDDFGKTEMGRDLLSQDYLLKQITSSLMYPESGLGKEFWDRVYERAYKEFGTSNVPVDTFNKVWIIPDEAAVYESGNTAYILRNHLKVMLEEDYLSLEKHSGITSNPVIQHDGHALASKIIKQIILPELEREVNEGKNFAMLRQIYSGMILATWYKHALKESLLGKVYANKAKIIGIDQKDPSVNEAIYQRYLKAFKKGVFNYIKDDTDKYSQQLIPRKYFAGGMIDFATVVTDPVAVTKGFSQAAVLVLNGKDFGKTNEAMRSKIDVAGIVQDVSDIDSATVNMNSAMTVNDLKDIQAAFEGEIAQAETLSGLRSLFRNWSDTFAPDRFLDNKELSDQAYQSYQKLRRATDKRNVELSPLAIDWEAWEGNKTEWSSGWEASDRPPKFTRVHLTISGIARSAHPQTSRWADILGTGHKPSDASHFSVPTKERAVKDLRKHDLVLIKYLEEIVAKVSREVNQGKEYVNGDEKQNEIDDDRFKGIFSIELHDLFYKEYGIDVEFDQLHSIGHGVFSFEGKEIIARFTDGQYRLVENAGEEGMPYHAKIGIFLEELADSMVNPKNAAMTVDHRAQLNGGIDLNSANLNLQIKRDGHGVPLPLLQQDWAQLSQIKGFIPIIAEIEPVRTLSILSELQQKSR